MTPPTCPCAAARLAPPRPAAVVNAEIHRLVSLAPLADADRARLAALWAERLAAAEVELAA